MTNDYSKIEQEIEQLTPFQAIQEMPASVLNEAITSMALMLAVCKAADALKDDLILRADIGTYDGDHSVQAGNSVWHNICTTLESLHEHISDEKGQAE